MDSKPILIAAFTKGYDLQNDALYNKSDILKAYELIGEQYEKLIIFSRKNDDFFRFKALLNEQPFTCSIATEVKSSLKEVLEDLSESQKDKELHLLLPRTLRGVSFNLLQGFNKKTLDEFQHLHIRAFNFNDRKEPYRRWIHEEYPLEEVLPKKTFEKLDSLSRQNYRILLLGDEGTDKEEIAKSLHQKLRGHLTQFLSLEGADFEIETVNNWMNEHPNGTIYIEDIGDLQQDEQKQQFTGFKDFLDQNPKYAVILSATEAALLSPISVDVKESLKKELKILGFESIKIPNLHERDGKQMETLLNYFVHRLGIHKKRKERLDLENVFTELKKYPFPGNLWEMEEMIRVLYQKDIQKVSLADLQELLLVELKDLDTSVYTLNASMRERFLVKFATSRLQKSLKSVKEFSIIQLSKLLGWERKKTSKMIKETENN